MSEIRSRLAAYCEQRGFHGPFQDQEKFDRTPGWEGFGNCRVCGSTRKVFAEELARRRKERS